MWTFASGSPTELRRCTARRSRECVLLLPEYCWRLCGSEVSLQLGSCECATAGKRGGVCLRLQMALVHVPVRNVDDKRRDEDERASGRL